MPRPLHLAFAAVAVLLQLCAAQNAPSPSPETPVNRYLQVMSDTARALQKGQPLYDFKARPVVGNGVQTLLLDNAPASSCLSPSADSAACSVVQGLVVMPVVCVAIALFTFLFWLSFVCARKYCQCCCGNCGGRKPQPEGGKYSNVSKVVVASILFLSSCIIIAITSMAMSAAYDAPGTLGQFYTSVLDFLDRGTSFLNSANSFVLSNGNTIGTAIDVVQTSFASLQNTLNSSQISAHAGLLAMSHSLTVVSASCSNFSASSASALRCNSTVASFRAKISSSISSLNKFEVKSLALSNAANDIAPRLANNTAPTRQAIAQGANFTSTSRKSLLTLQIETSNPQAQAQLGTLLLFGSMWLIPLFFAFGFMCHKWTHWYFPMWISFLGSFVFWILLAGLYVLSYILNYACDVTPTDTSPRATQPLATGLSSPLMQSFFDECVTQGGSKSLFKVVNVSTALLDKQIADFSLARQVNISYISEYNQTLLQEVKDNQAVFNNLNATSFIDASGVSLGAAALQAIQNVVACGSRTYTLSNASECLRICTAAAMSNCRTAAAYAFITLHSLRLSQLNPSVLANISSMNFTVTAIVPAINVADVQLKTALAALSAGFSRFDQCGWIGKSFVSIRTNVCGNVADTINVMWLCCGVLGFVLMYVPVAIVKAEKRFKRKDPVKERIQSREKYNAAIQQRRQSQAALNVSNPASPAADPAAADASTGVFVIDIPQNMLPSAPYEEPSIPISAAPHVAAAPAPLMHASTGRGPLRNPYSQ